MSPTALLFGAWHSTGEGGGLGAKFARCLISEIVGVNVPVDEVVTNQRTGEIEAQTSGRRTGSRIDPLGVLRKVKVFKGADGWSTTKDGAGRNAKEVRPSEINHGNIAPSVQPLGITCDHLEHSFVLSFAALRRLRFGGAAKDVAGRSLLAALGLVALAEQDARGYALRSRCDLVCEGRASLQLVRPDGSTEDMAVNRKAAHALYEAAYDATRGHQRGIRGVRASASLKVGVAKLSAGRHDRHPRRTRLGLIEGEPALFAGGDGLRLHPRRTRLGLIEAIRSCWRFGFPPPPIRGVRASASLKRPSRRHAASPGICWPGTASTGLMQLRPGSLLNLAL